jgi:fucose permease
VPVVLIGGLGLALIGFTGLLVPSLVPSIEARFGQSDAGLGIALFFIASAYALGSFAGGALTERLGRRRVLSTAARMLAAGLVGQAVVGTWVLFVAGAVFAAIGSGALDGGMNALMLDAYRERASGRLNAAHLGFGVGALAAPLLVGQVVARGLDWQPLFAATALPALGFALLLSRAPMPSGRHDHEADPAASRTAIFRSLSFIALGVAIATYVSAEIGVSTWLVRYLSAAPLELATGGLSVYWGGLALGRLVGALTADRIPTVPFAITAALASAVSLVGAVVASDVTVSIVLFGVVGFWSGPIYPLIISIAGRRFPTRAAIVAGSLAGIAVIGGVVYPPLMGLLSESIGISGGMLGAAALGVACAAAIFVGSRRRSG